MKFETILVWKTKLSCFVVKSVVQNSYFTPYPITLMLIKMRLNMDHAWSLVGLALDDQTQVDSKPGGQPEHATLNQCQLIAL